MRAQLAPTSSLQPSESSSCVKSLFLVHRKRSTRIGKLKIPTKGREELVGYEIVTYNSIALITELVQITKLSLTLIELI